LLNNIPEHVEKLYIVEDQNERKKINIVNLPLTIKKIIIREEKHKKYLIKIPFGTILEVKDSKNFTF
jgi:hypothetical protein